MSAPEPFWSDGQITLFHGDCLDVLRQLPEASVDAVVTDPPYGLEFMGREWDGADGFRRSLNEADAGRDNVFGRTSRTSPEYRTGSETWRAGAGMSKPGIGERPTEWPSFGGKDSANATCATCGGRMRGARKCACPEPDWRVKGQPLDGREGQSQMHLYQRWCQAWAAECLRVLKPGAFMLAFGGTRTWHRLSCGIEDAGFEIRDSVGDLTGLDGPGLLWVYGEGFPKNLDAGRAIDMYLCQLPGKHCMREIPADAGPGDHVCPQSAEGDPWRGWGTTCKPAWEPIIVARKPLAGTVAQNVLAHGTGALNIDGCRVDGVKPNREVVKVQENNWDGGGPWKSSGLARGTTTEGRWPANLVLGAAAAAELDRQSGVTVSRVGKPRSAAAPGPGWGMTHTGAEHADAGGASRFFPVFRYEAKAGQGERPRLEDGTSWPTVKPVDLMRWLVRLVTPPGGTVGDFFAGTGPTGEACIIEGFDCILADKDPTAVALIRTRLRKDIQPDMFGAAS